MSAEQPLTTTGPPTDFHAASASASEWQTACFTTGTPAFANSARLSASFNVRPTGSGALAIVRMPIRPGPALRLGHQFMVRDELRQRVDRLGFQRKHGRALGPELGGDMRLPRGDDDRLARGAGEAADIAGKARQIIARPRNRKVDLEAIGLGLAGDHGKNFAEQAVVGQQGRRQIDRVGRARERGEDFVQCRACRLVELHHLEPRKRGRVRAHHARRARCPKW